MYFKDWPSRDIWLQKMNIIWSHMGNIVQNRNVQDCPPPPQFHLHYFSIDCDAQDQIFQKRTTQSRTPALYTHWIIIFISPSSTFSYICVSKYVHLNYATILHSLVNQGITSLCPARFINSHVLWYLHSESKLLHLIFELLVKEKPI